MAQALAVAACYPCTLGGATRCASTVARQEAQRRRKGKRRSLNTLKRLRADLRRFSLRHWTLAQRRLLSARLPGHLAFNGFASDPARGATHTRKANTFLRKEVV